jgi:hypothetical protein
MMTKSLDQPHIPPRGGIFEDGREVLERLRGSSQTIHVVLVALTDGVELEVWADGMLRRRSRFIRDGEARKQADRLAGRLERRGYRRGLETS